MVSNCQVFAYSRQRQFGGVIVLVPSLYAGPQKNRWWWRPMWKLLGAMAQWAWYRDTGRWQHAVWAETLPGTREHWQEFEPIERRHLRGFPLMFSGRPGILAADYWRHYGAKQWITQNSKP